jgi:hypothetical protein
MLIFIKTYIFILTVLNTLKEREYLLFINLSHINFGRDLNIPKKFIALFPFHFKKKYLNRINIINVLINNMKHFDKLGRSLLNLNTVILKFVIAVSLIKESVHLLKKYYNFSNFVLNKKMTHYLFYIKPKSFFFLPSNLIIFKKNLNYKLDYNYSLINIRSMYSDIFNLNIFKHSGIFEAV